MRRWRVVKKRGIMWWLTLTQWNKVCMTIIMESI